MFRLEQFLQSMCENPSKPLSLFLIATILAGCTPQSNHSDAFHFGEDLTKLCDEDINQNTPEVLITSSTSPVNSALSLDVKKCRDDAIFMVIKIDSDNRYIRSAQSYILRTPNGVKSVVIRWSASGLTANIDVIDLNGTLDTVHMDSFL